MNMRSEARKRDRELDVQTAAYLLALGRTQEQIGRQLNVSQSVVSRMLREAKDNQWLSTRVELARGKIGSDRLREIEARLEPRDLIELVQNCIPSSRKMLLSVKVLDSGSEGVDEESIRQRQARFGALAAPHVAELLQHSNLVGVAWGSTIGHIVEALEKLNMEAPRGGDIRFFPLSGEPMGNAGLRFSSSHLAVALGKLLGHSEKPTPSLAGVPALIPISFSDSDVRVLKKLFSKFEDHRLIFGTSDRVRDSSALAHRADTIFTSMGRSANTLGWFEDALTRGGEVDRKELSRLVLGDVCGVLLPRPRLAPEERKKLQRIRRHWTGIDQQTMARCARLAVEGRGRGVIVACIGGNADEAMLEAIGKGLVNHILIDHDLATAIKARLLAEHSSA